MDINTQPLSILLVEDDDVDAMGVERALRKNKILNKFHRVKNGSDALALLKSPDAIPRPFLILLDLNMPRMGGIEFLDKLRQDPSLTNCVVFILTTSKDDEDRIKAYDRHVAGFILKDNVGDGFMSLIEMLDHYWRLIELPQ